MAGQSVAEEEEQKRQLSVREIACRSFSLVGKVAAALGHVIPKLGFCSFSPLLFLTSFPLQPHRVCLGPHTSAC